MLKTKATTINFDNTDFYSSSTKGQTRLLNCLKHKVLDVSLEELESIQRGFVLAEYKAELNVDWNIGWKLADEKVINIAFASAISFI